MRAEEFLDVLDASDEQDFQRGFDKVRGASNLVQPRQGIGVINGGSPSLSASNLVQPRQ